MMAKEAILIGEECEQDIVLTEDELKLAEFHAKKHYYVTKLLRNYKIIYSNIYRESLQASKSDLVKIDKLISSTNEPTNKSRLLDAKKKCLATIGTLEELCTHKENQILTNSTSNEPMSDHELSQHFKHKK